VSFRCFHSSHRIAKPLPSSILDISSQKETQYPSTSPFPPALSNHIFFCLYRFCVRNISHKEKNYNIWSFITGFCHNIVFSVLKYLTACFRTLFLLRAKIVFYCKRSCTLLSHSSFPEGLGVSAFWLLGRRLLCPSTCKLLG
jgi:hypothetical protein